MTSKPQFLKAELVQTRNVETLASSNGYEILFSIELPVDDIFEHPTNSTFHVVELLQYRAKKFIPTWNGANVDEEFMYQVLKQDGTGGNSITYRNLYLDTSVPDASQAATVTEQVDVENRWLASSTNVHYTRDIYAKIQFASAVDGQSSTAYDHMGDDFTRTWIDATDQDGKGPLIVTPRLIVRFSILNKQNGLGAWNIDFNEIIEFQMMYRTRRISKADMFGLLRRQQAQETLLRSGSAAFPG